MEKFDFAEIQFMIKSCQNMVPLRFMPYACRQKVADVHNSLLEMTKKMDIDSKVSLSFDYDQLNVLCDVVDCNVTCCYYWLKHTVPGKMMQSVFSKLQNAVENFD